MRILAKHRRTVRGIFELPLSIVSSKFFLRAAFVWFIVQGIFFAVTTRVGLPPDETYHLAFIGLFADSNFSPFVTNQADYLALGEVVRTPFFLYHYLFGFLYSAIGGWEHSIIVLRLLNLALGAGSLYLVYRIAGELKISNLVRNLSIFMLSGTLMFVFLAAAVSYDNLFIFLSLAGILLLLKLLDKITASRLLLLAGVLAAGSMVKLNFLAIAVAVVVVLLYAYRRRFKKVWRDFASTFRSTQKLNIALCVMLLLLGILMVHRYGYNVVKYHTYAPSCEQVMTVEECRHNALFVRNEMVFGEGRLTPDKDPFEYLYDWIPLVQTRTYGIYAHEELSPFRITSLWLQALAVITFVAVVRMWSRKDQRITMLLGIIIFYMAALLIENYQLFLDSGRFSFVVHGRYLFAILPLVYIIGNHYTLTLLKNLYVKSAFVVIAVGMFALSSLPTYVVRTNTEWYTPQSKPILRQLGILR